jgi:hypothetical protein
MSTTYPASSPAGSTALGTRAAPAFISYSHDDLEFAERLTGDLEAQRIACFIDQTGLQKGTPDWDEAIRQAVRTSSAVLPIASPRSRQSRYVRSELDVASMYQRPIYPVWASGEQFVDSVPLGMSTVQYIDARGEHYGHGLLELTRTRSESAYAEQTKQYQRMLDLYTQASTQLASALAHNDEQAAEEILRDLGDEALTENADWVLLHRSHLVELPIGA